MNRTLHTCANFRFQYHSTAEILVS